MEQQEEGMVDRKSLRLSAALLVAGAIVFAVAGYFHPAGANDYQAAFTNYAGSTYWTLVHAGQFAGMATLIFGLVALFFALGVNSGVLGKVSRFAAASATAALALYGALQAVDGVALKQAVDAWASAPTALEQSAHFAVAQGIRWLEWGVRGYFDFVFGLSLVLFASVIVSTARIPRPVGYIMGLSGLNYIALGYVVGTEGFSPTHALLSYVGIPLDLAWIIALAVVSAYLMKQRRTIRRGPIGTPFSSG